MSVFRRGGLKAVKLLIIFSLIFSWAAPGFTGDMVGAAGQPPLTGGRLPGAAAGGPGAGASADPSAGTPPGYIESYAVTLITGDKVLYDADADGLEAITTIPARRDGYETSFQTFTAGGSTYVFPLDVMPLIPEVLDKELFNITGLVAQGYHDGAYDDIPVIIVGTGVGGGGGGIAGGIGGSPDLHIKHSFRSFPGVAAGVPKDAAPRLGTLFGRVSDAIARGLTPEAHHLSPDTGLGDESRDYGGFFRELLGGGVKIWLDRRADVALEDSRDQIGAPGAWDLGYDGAGITVAVLDTGIDLDHPDLAGKVSVSANFTDSETDYDEHGHGTHVAGIIAGTGEASEGERKGVAPGVRLLNGKVMDADGRGPWSAIIAGMEWAAEQGADVINMSLGSDSGDSTDPASLAVNSLTEEYGVLFVVAAGNSGPMQYSIGSPGAADAALTVGNVTKADGLNRDSSRGPRVGDHAIKPDITAPGTDIAAPRAAGTRMGTPIDGIYTRASGTSMAAPHVAGAAAVLLQARPELTPGQVKAILSSTALRNPDLTVYQQGGGRLDVMRALTQPVHASDGVLNFGHHPFEIAMPGGDGDDDPGVVTRSVSYTNRGDEPVELELSVTLADEHGGALPEGVAVLRAGRITLAPGETGEAELTIDVRESPGGLFGGYLEAVGDDGGIRLQTAVGYYKERETYEVTVHGITRDGEPAGAMSGVNVFRVDDLGEFSSASSFARGPAVFQLEEGTYTLIGGLFTQEEGNPYPTEVSFVPMLELHVDGDTEVILDATEAVKIRVETPRPAEPGIVTTMAYYIRSAGGMGYSQVIQGIGVGDNVYAAPTQEAAMGRFEFYSRWRLYGDGYKYDLVFPESGRIPAEMNYTVTDDELAATEAAYHADSAGLSRGVVRHFWMPYEVASVAPSLMLTAPAARTEYTRVIDAKFEQRVYGQYPLSIGMTEMKTMYEPGESRSIAWWKQPFRPGPVPGNQWHDQRLNYRQEDTLHLDILEFIAGDGGHYGERDSRQDETAFRLYADGELIAEGERASGEYPMLPDKARYRMELDVSRAVPWVAYSTETRTAWAFESERPETIEEKAALPLITADYGLDLDLLNMLRSPELTVTLGHQKGSSGAPFTAVQLWASYDGGGTWAEAAISPSSSAARGPAADQEGNPAAVFTAVLPGGWEAGGTVSLRLYAADEEGNALEQDILHAAAPAEEVTPGPTLTIASPEDGTITNRDAVTVAGAAADGGERGLIETVTINGRRVSVGSDGSFAGRVILDEGENTITVTAVGSGGRSATETVTVTAVWRAPEPIPASMEPAADISLAWGGAAVFRFTGEPGLTAAYQISVAGSPGTWHARDIPVTGTPMSEVEPGVYEAVYTAPEGVMLDKALIQFNMGDAAGNVTMITAPGRLSVTGDS